MKVNKKGRGPTECAYINILEENIEIDINEGNQSIGPNTVKLASLLGVLAKEMVTKTYSYWRKVSDELKEDMWNIINVSIRHYVYFFSTFYFSMPSIFIFKPCMTSNNASLVCCIQNS